MRVAYKVAPPFRQPSPLRCGGTVGPAGGLVAGPFMGVVVVGKRGPSPKPPDLLRTVRVNVYLHPSEAVLLDQARQRVGLERGPYMRLAALDRLPQSIPELNRDAWSELSRLAANLNQYQHAINEGRIDSGVPVSEIEALRKQVDALRRQLLGISDQWGDEDETES